MRLLGGKYPDGENFDEEVWIKSLEDYQNWECIEFKNPISILQLLPDIQRKKILKSVRKRILHTSIKEYNFNLHPEEQEFTN